MRQKQASFRLEDWLKQELDNFMKDNNITNRTEGLHKYILDLKRQVEEQRKEIKRLNSGLDYSLRLNAKALKFEGKITEILNIIKKQAQKQPRSIEEAKQTAIEHQKLEADSTQKPQRKKRFRPFSGYEKTIGQQTTDGSERCLRTKKLIHPSKECKKCKEKTPDYFEQCEELKRPFLKRSLA